MGLGLHLKPGMVDTTSRKICVELLQAVATFFRGFEAFGTISEADYYRGLKYLPTLFLGVPSCNYSIIYPKTLF